MNDYVLTSFRQKKARPWQPSKRAHKEIKAACSYGRANQPMEQAAFISGAVIADPRPDGIAPDITEMNH